MYALALSKRLKRAADASAKEAESIKKKAEYAQVHIRIIA